MGKIPKKNSEKYSKKLFWGLIISLIFLIGITMGIVMIQRNIHVNPNEVIARVNNEPITYGEFLIYFPKNRTDTMSYINGKYGTQDSRDYWTKDYGNGDIPIELAKKSTLDESSQM